MTCVVGTIGDGGRTLDALAREHGFGAGTLDFVFLDHDKKAYLDDLQSILDRGWLHPGSIVVADNVKVPGAPKYRAYMREQQGKRWKTVEHKAHLEYQTWCPTWCWSPNTWARSAELSAPAGGLRPTPRAGRAR